MWARMKQGHSSGSPMNLGPSEGTRGHLQQVGCRDPAFGGGSSRACRPRSTWLVLVHGGPRWPFSVCASAGLPGSPDGDLSPDAEACTPCLGQRSWVSPALVLLRIWLQASGGGSSGRSLPLPEGASPWRSQPHPNPLFAGPQQCHSQDHPGDHLSLQSKNRGKVLPGGRNVLFTEPPAGEETG